MLVVLIIWPCLNWFFLHYHTSYSQPDSLKCIICIVLNSSHNYWGFIGKNGSFQIISSSSSCCSLRILCGYLDFSSSAWVEHRGRATSQNTVWLFFFTLRTFKKQKETSKGSKSVRLVLPINVQSWWRRGTTQIPSRWPAAQRTPEPSRGSFTARPRKTFTSRTTSSSRDTTWPCPRWTRPCWENTAAGGEQRCYHPPFCCSRRTGKKTQVRHCRFHVPFLLPLTHRNRGTHCGI